MPLPPERVEDFNQLAYATQDGKPFLFNRMDGWVGRSFEEYGEWSGGEDDLFRELLFPGMCALDIGANVGAHTVAMAEAVGPRGTVLAFEPQRLAYYNLIANVALRSYQHVYPHNAAIGNARGEIKIPMLDYTYRNNVSGLSLDPDAPGFEGCQAFDTVPVLPIDDLNLPRVHLIKADVEGMEIDVVKGGANTIAAHKPLLYLEADRVHKRHALLRYLNDVLAYDAYWHTPPLFRADNPKHQTRNIFPDESGGSLVSFMWLCVARSRGVTMDARLVVEADL